MGGEAEMIEECGSCKFWKQTVAKKNVGFCKRYPPTALSMLNVKAGTSEVTKCSPGMVDDEWCGEYKPKLLM
jgi:hypothetical protein